MKRSERVLEVAERVVYLRQELAAAEMLLADILDESPKRAKPKPRAPAKPRRVAPPPAPPKEAANSDAGKGQRQMAVLALVREGKNAKEIAQSLSTSRSAVYGHICHLRNKGLLPRQADA